MPQHVTVHLPALGAMVRHGGKHLLESTLVPLCLFYLLLTIVGLDGGLIAALSWSVLALARTWARLVERSPARPIVMRCG